MGCGPVFATTESRAGSAFAPDDAALVGEDVDVAAVDGGLGVFVVVPLVVVPLDVVPLDVGVPDVTGWADVDVEVVGVDAVEATDGLGDDEELALVLSAPSPQAVSANKAHTTRAL